jgi:hypothetical protein
MVLAEIYGIAEQPDEGLTRLTAATQLMEETNERWVEVEINSLRGKLL